MVIQVVCVTHKLLERCETVKLRRELNNYITGTIQQLYTTLLLLLKPSLVVLTIDTSKQIMKAPHTLFCISKNKNVDILI
jgi:hypothetical protein